MDKIIVSLLLGFFMLFSNSAFAYDCYYGNNSPLNFSSPMNIVSPDPIQSTINPLNIHYQERQRKNAQVNVDVKRVRAGELSESEQVILMLAVLFVGASLFISFILI